MAKKFELFHGLLRRRQSGVIGADPFADTPVVDREDVPAAEEVRALPGRGGRPARVPRRGSRSEAWLASPHTERYTAPMHV